MTSAPVHPYGPASQQGAGPQRTHGPLFWVVIAVVITFSVAVLVSVLAVVVIWQLGRSLSNIDLLPGLEEGGTSSWMAPCHREGTGEQLEDVCQRHGRPG